MFPAIFINLQKDPGRNQLLLKYVERFGILLAENLHRGLISTVSSDNLSMCLIFLSIDASTYIFYLHSY